MRRLFRSLAPLVFCFLLLPGLRPAAAYDGIRRCVGSADVYVDGGGGVMPAPNTPTNPSTDLSGPQAVLHAHFERGVSSTNQGQVQYTLVDQATLQTICEAFGPVVDDGTDSPYVVQEDLQTGLSYAWVARSYDGWYYSPPTAPQTFIFEPPTGTEAPVPVGSPEYGTLDAPEITFTPLTRSLVDLVDLGEPTQGLGGGVPTGYAPTSVSTPGDEQGLVVDGTPQSDQGSTAHLLKKFSGPPRRNVDPADPTVAVGTNYAVVAVNDDPVNKDTNNVRINVRDAASTASLAAFDFRDHFNVSELVFDPWIIFDRSTGYYFMVVATPSNHMFVVTAQEVSGGISWCGTYTLYLPPGYSGFPDYPKVGVNAAGLVVTANASDPRRSVHLRIRSAKQDQHGKVQEHTILSLVWRPAAEPRWVCAAHDSASQQQGRHTD
jgi:hypothetical protein